MTITSLRFLYILRGSGLLWAARASFGVAGVGCLMLFKIILHNIKVKFSRSSELYMAAALLMSCGLQTQYVR